MCFFPQSSIKTKIGRSSYDIQCTCGACPECLSKRARLWALRCSMEAKVSLGIMVTLTYDEFKYDKNGRILGEVEKDYSNIELSKRDCQLFIKRVRKHFDTQCVKYLITAEFGKRTHRPHYHAILFNVPLDDIVPYKMSKRGNQIYMSKTLTELWTHGICTVDSINISSKIARYCTKYCAKDACPGNNDTFMLTSRGIGDVELKRQFNGLYYILDGKKYPIPRQIWNDYIRNKYHLSGKYVNYPFKDGIDQDAGRLDPFARFLSYQRKMDAYNTFLHVKHSDSVYRRYIKYWADRSLELKRTQKPVQQRINELSDISYFGYKRKAMEYLCKKEIGNTYYVYNELDQPILERYKLKLLIPPRSNIGSRGFSRVEKIDCHFAGKSSCLITANDTNLPNELINSQSFKKSYTDFIKKHGINLHNKWQKRLVIPLSCFKTAYFNKNLSRIVYLRPKFSS